MTIQEILTCKEDQTFEWKGIQIDPKALAIPIVAFANADGGIIAIGVSDNFSRNPQIAAFLKAYNYVKEYGEGVDRMCRELEVNGTIAPVFHADDFILKVAVAKVTENPNRVTEKLPENTRNKGLDKAKIQQMIIQYLQNAGSSGAKRDAIFEYLKEVLPQNKTQEQQERMIGNILSEMKEKGLIHPEGRTWFLQS